MRERAYFDGIQALRFVAAFMVVICHACYYTTERLGTNIVWSEGARGVDVFFVISGFVMVVASRKLFGDPKGYRTFITKRLLRIVPLYWAATTVSVAALVFASEYVLHDRLDWPFVVKSYLFIPALNADGQVMPVHGVGWTLTFEMFFYAIFALALFLRRNVWAICTAIIVPLALISLFKTPDQRLSLFYADPILLEFLAGMYIALAVQERRILPFIPALAAVAGSMLFLCLFPETEAVGRVVQAGIPGAILVYAVASIEAARRIPVPRFVLFQGMASYSLYLFHPLSAPIAPVVLREMGVRNAPLSVALGVALAIFAGSVAYVLIEKTMAERIPRLWRERWASRRAVTQ